MRHPLDHVLDIGIVDAERARMGGGVGEIVAAGAAAALGEGHVMRLPLDRQVAAILAVPGSTSKVTAVTVRPSRSFVGTHCGL